MTKLLGRGLLLWALLVMTAVSFAQGGQPAHAAAVSLATTKCGFTLGKGIVAGRDVRCGYLAVPESRVYPGRTIRLAVAIFKSTDTHRSSVPLIFLQGGPGGAIVADVGSAITSANRATVVGDHDLILVDQRGTGLSTPALSCPEVDRLTISLLSKDVTAQRSATLYEQAMAQCHARLVGQGIDLSAYTTYNNAADVHDLIMALGYPSVDVYGVSYGTRVALEIERSFPQRVNRVILDSTVPTQLRLQPSVAGARTRVFATLFAGCRANATCNQKYPYLQGTFDKLVAQLNVKPLVFTATDGSTNKSYSVLMKGADFYDFVWQVFYVSPYIPYIPDLIHQVSTGDHRLISVLYGILGFDTSTNLGVYYSVECAESIPYTSQAEVTQADWVYPATVRDANTVSDLADFTVCRNWHVPTAPAWQLRPVYTHIPTLILEDQYDPITPPANGAAAAATIPSAIQVGFPGLGHGAYIFSGSACPTTVVRSFLNGHTDRSCVAAMSGPAFV